MELADIIGIAKSISADAGWVLVVGVYLAVKLRWIRIGEKPEQAKDPDCDPLNGARCPEIKGLMTVPDTLKIIQTDIGEIRAHEKASRDFLVHEREETRKDVESLFEQTRGHDKDIATLTERTKDL